MMHRVRERWQRVFTKVRDASRWAALIRQWRTEMDAEGRDWLG